MPRSIACGHGKNCQFIQKLNLVIDIDDHKIGHTAVSTKKKPDQNGRGFSAEKQTAYTWPKLIIASATLTKPAIFEPLR